MSNSAQNDTIDLSASAARVSSARYLAEAQAKLVEAAFEGADDHSIDLLFLLQENVLVLSETHVMLEKLAGLDRRREELAAPEPSAFPGRWSRSGRKALSYAALLALAVVASAWALEILDPAPMDVEAGIARILRPSK